MLKTPSRPRRAKTAWGWLSRRLCLALGAIFTADWLIFGHAGGLSLAMFVVTLGAMVVAANPLRAGWRAQILAATLLTASIVSLVNDLNLLSFCCGLVSLTAFAVILTSKRLPDWPAILRRAAVLPVAGPFRLIADLWRIYRLSPLKRGWSIAIAFALKWVAPVLLFGVFLALLTSANPVIELWFRSLDFRMPSGHFDPIRAVFWIFILLVTWPLLHIPSQLKKPNPPAQSVPTVATGDASIFFAEPAIVRSLLLLNALFAVQSALDLNYLWAGAQLPAGMTYADYAHRGAYPLMATALLAAAIVLMTMRAGGPGEKSRLIRSLVLVWTAQNVLLVVSSILRLDLYVAVYSLTYWRVAALIWMALVALGLVLIFVQVLGRKSGRWLVTMNAAALAITLYGCSLINFLAVIVQYNFDHSRDGGGAGQALDIGYLVSLGPYALPVIDQLLPHRPAHGPDLSCCNLTDQRAALVMAHRRSQQDWRAWSLQAWRLSRYLDMKDSDRVPAP